MIKKRIIARNIFSNLGGYAVVTVVAFFLSPFMVHKLGDTGYGLWTLIVSLSGYFNLMDIGIRNAVGRFVARYITLDDPQGVNTSVNSAFCFLSIVGTLGLLITVVLSFYFNRFFDVPLEYQAITKYLILLVGGTICIGLPLSCFESVLFAFERYDLINMVDVFATMLRALLIITALNTGFGILSLAFITLGVSVLDYLIRARIAFRLYPALKLRFQFGGRKFFKEIFSYSGYVFILAISAKVIFYTDSLVIGKFLTLGAITYYVIASKLIRYGGDLISAVVRVFFPIAAKLDAKNDFHQLRTLLTKGTKFVSLLSLPLCVLSITLGGQLIGLWMGREYVAISWPILIVLTLPPLFAMPQRISGVIIMGMAKHKYLANLSIIEAAANLILSIILVKKIGLIGVAWGTAIPAVLKHLFFVPFYTCGLLQMRLSTYLKEALLMPVLIALPLGILSILFMTQVPQPTWGFLLYEVTICCGVFYALAYFTCLDHEQRTKVMTKIRPILKGALAKT